MRRSGDPLQLLVVDLAPSDAKGDKLLYIFGCGPLGYDETRIELDHNELDRWAWVQATALPGCVIPRLARRLSCAYGALNRAEPLYLEHGKPALDRVQVRDVPSLRPA